MDDRNKLSTVRSLKPGPRLKRRVLVVDDDLDTVHSMATLLKLMGHEAHFAINGLAAIEIARKLRPELILIDMGLPDYNGEHIARQLKWEPGMEKTRIIALAGRSDDAVRQSARDAGCEGLYVKPLEVALLEQLLA